MGWGILALFAVVAVAEYGPAAFAWLQNEMEQPPAPPLVFHSPGGNVEPQIAASDLRGERPRPVRQPRQRDSKPKNGVRAIEPEHERCKGSPPIGLTEPASDARAQHEAGKVEKEHGKEARRSMHDAKEGGEGDRTLEQLQQDAADAGQ